MPPTDCVFISGHLLGPREYEILQLLCTHGRATVRELLRWLNAEPPIAYQTLLTICVRLTEKGLVERRMALSGAEVLRYGKGYIYTPLARCHRASANCDNTFSGYMGSQSTSG